jgi:hypothetical protein
MKVWVVEEWIRTTDHEWIMGYKLFPDPMSAREANRSPRATPYSSTWTEVVEVELASLPETLSSPKALNALDPAILLDSLKSMTKEQRSEFFFECYRAECETLSAMNVGLPMTLRGFDGTPITFGP